MRPGALERVRGVQTRGRLEGRGRIPEPSHLGEGPPAPGAAARIADCSAPASIAARQHCRLGARVPPCSLPVVARRLRRLRRPGLAPVRQVPQGPGCLFVRPGALERVRGVHVGGRPEGRGRIREHSLLPKLPPAPGASAGPLGPVLAARLLVQFDGPRIVPGGPAAPGRPLRRHLVLGAARGPHGRGAFFVRPCAVEGSLRIERDGRLERRRRLGAPPGSRQRPAALRAARGRPP